MIPELHDVNNKTLVIFIERKFRSYPSKDGLTHSALCDLRRLPGRFSCAVKKIAKDTGKKMVKDWIQDTIEMKDNAAFLEGLFFTSAFMER